VTIAWAKRPVAEAAAARAEKSTDKDLPLLTAKLERARGARSTSWRRSRRPGTSERPGRPRYGNHAANRASEKTEGLAGNHRLTAVILGSPTWARTRDLRINSCELTD